MPQQAEEGGVTGVKQHLGLQEIVDSLQLGLGQNETVDLLLTAGTRHQDSTHQHRVGVLLFGRLETEKYRGRIRRFSNCASIDLKIAQIGIPKVILLSYIFLKIWLILSPQFEYFSIKSCAARMRWFFCRIKIFIFCKKDSYQQVVRGRNF